MLIAWKYRDRGTLVQTFDPRARLVLMFCMLAALVQVWDLRWLLALLGIAAAQYALARLTFAETRRFWLFAGAMGLGLTLLTALTDQTIQPGPAGTHGLHPWIVLGPVSIAREKGLFAAAQLIRILAIALLAVVIPFTINPALYGITFRGLGLNDRLAFAMDLSFRFVPSLAAEFGGAIDAQKARGFELDSRADSPVGRIRRLAPLIVPVTVNAIVGAEEMIDAMELRGFGVRPRTWYAELKWRHRDTMLLIVAAIILAAVTAAHVMGYTGLWMPGG